MAKYRPLKKWRSYKEFLESSDWQKMRKKVLSRDKGKCQLCGGKATQVHHKIYTTRFYHLEKLENLIAICSTCHSKIHEQKRKELNKKIYIQQNQNQKIEIKEKPEQYEGNLLCMILEKLIIIEEKLDQLNEIDKQKIKFLQSIELNNKEPVWFKINEYLNKTLQKLEQN